MNTEMTTKSDETKLTYEEKRRFQRQAELDELNGRIETFVDAVRKGLIDAGHELKGDGVWEVDGHYVWFGVDKQRKSGYAGLFRSSYTGKLYYKIGDYGDKKTYPEPKKGFDVAKAVERIEKRVNGLKIRAAREAAKKAADKSARKTFLEACEKIGKTDVWDYATEVNNPTTTVRKVTQFTEEHVVVSFKVTPDELDKLVKMAELVKTL
jgi:hypothetical protein